MPIPSLYETCVDRTCVLLKMGAWKDCSTNPFALVPGVAVNDVMSHLPSVLPPKFTTISHLQPLLICGWLQHLDMLECRVEWSICRLLDLLLEGGRSLQTLVLPAREFHDSRPEQTALASEKLEALLRLCPHLSDLHTPLLFDLRMLHHLPRLRSLRLHLPSRPLMDLFAEPDPDLMGCLKHLRVLSACGKLSRHPARTIVEQLLRHCPQLTSVGRLDSAIALQRLHASRDGRGPLQLRKCAWVTDQYEDLAYLNLSVTFRLGFPNAIDTSVRLCPLLQELRIKVLHRGAIPHLARLEHLTALDIDIVECHEDDGRYDVYRVLDEIGGRLKRLALRGPFNAPVDVGGLCDRCPGLEYLRLLCAMNLSGPVRVACRFPLLRSLLLYRCPRDVFLFLLGNCPHLRELAVNCVDGLDDDLLMSVLGHNPLSELEDASIFGCVVTCEGLTRFLERARALKRFDFVSTTVHFERAQGIVETISPRVAFRQRSLLGMFSFEEFYETPNQLCNL